MINRDICKEKSIYIFYIMYNCNHIYNINNKIYNYSENMYIPLFTINIYHTKELYKGATSPPTPSPTLCVSCITGPWCSCHVDQPTSYYDNSWRGSTSRGGYWLLGDRGRTGVMSTKTQIEGLEDKKSGKMKREVKWTLVGWGWVSSMCASVHPLGHVCAYARVFVCVCVRPCVCVCVCVCVSEREG